MCMGCSRDASILFLSKVGLVVFVMSMDTLVQVSGSAAHLLNGLVFVFTSVFLFCFLPASLSQLSRRVLYSYCRFFGPPQAYPCASMRSLRLEGFDVYCFTVMGI